VTRVLAVVEGYSEELFLNRKLTPHLAERGIYLSAMKVLRGGGARGGAIGLDVLRRRCPRFGAWIEQLENL
jgi:hypothetical protein